MRRKQSHDNTHLTLDERRIIQAGIENGTTKASIARTIGKDATTVAKEIRAHRIFKPRNTFNRPFLCAKMGTCPYLLDRQGEIAGVYHKNHLVITETTKATFICGKDTPLMNTDFGTVACALCFDLNCDELRLKYVKAQLDLILFHLCTTVA